MSGHHLCQYVRPPFVSLCQATICVIMSDKHLCQATIGVTMSGNHRCPYVGSPFVSLCQATIGVPMSGHHLCHYFWPLCASNQYVFIVSYLPSEYRKCLSL